MFFNLGVCLYPHTKFQFHTLKHDETRSRKKKKNKNKNKNKKKQRLHHFSSIDVLDD